MFSRREVEVHQKEPMLSYLQNIHPDPKICGASKLSELCMGSRERGTRSSNLG